MRGTRVLASAALIAAVVVQGAAVAAAPRATAVMSPVLATPVHNVSVSGSGVITYPAFSASVARYGITTTGATSGTVTVAATTTDPAGRVLVNGHVAPGGSRTVTGLEPGDEVAVFIEDSAGTARHSFIYLPPGFPVLERATPDPAPGALQPGAVLLTLSQWVRPTPPALDTFETAVDVNGVPLFAHRTDASMDLQRQPNGQLTVFRRSAVPGAGDDLVVLDDALRPVATRRTVGLKNTDGHDAILLPDGTLWLMAYEPRNPDGSGLVDAIIQRIDPDGTVGFQWSSAPYVADSVVAQNDYAHVNSMQVMADGDLLVSFRHFSSVFKIATSAHDGFEPGDVVWKLGGRDSSFTFPPGEGGPCAQHSARQLPDGHILMFDNGSWNSSQAMCVDPTNPDGPPVQRVQTRILELALDEEAGTATVAKSYAPPSWFAIFAGSAQHQANGNTLIGWAEETQALASEIDSTGNLLWQLKDPSATFPYFTYRAAKAVVPDVIDPAVIVASPAQSASYVEGATVATDYGCTDRGGSSLQTCVGPSTLDTSTPGTHTVTVSATDGAGGTASVTRSYRVLASTGVDASIRKAGSRRWVGEGSVGRAKEQRVRTSVAPAGRAKAVVRLRNDGALAASLTVAVSLRGKGFRVVDLGSGNLTTPVLQPGQTWVLRLKVVRRPSARPGDHVVVTVGGSTPSPVRGDGVSLRVAAKPA